MEQHNSLCTLLVTVHNRPGVLFKISGLIRKHRFNIESLHLTCTDNHNISRMTILMRGDHEIVERLRKQLNRLIEVINVDD
jgi:acetolactate synthase I/III small subunit